MLINHDADDDDADDDDADDDVNNGDDADADVSDDEHKNTKKMMMMMMTMMKMRNMMSGCQDERVMGSPDCLDGTKKQRRRLFAQELENISSLFVELEYVE